MGRGAGMSANGHSWVTASWGSYCSSCGMDRPARGEWSPSCQTVRETFGDPS